MESSSKKNSDQGEISEPEAMVKLRESFLNAINRLTGESCSILTYEKSTLEATFAGWNIEGTEVLVKDMKTPSHDVMSFALLRTPDIISMQFDRL